MSKKTLSAFNTIYLTQPLFNASFYGLKSLFLLYVLNQYFLPESEAVSLYATFMALCYATSLIGGYLSDHGLGVKKSVLLGGTLTVIGLLGILQPSIDFLYVGLSLTSIGSGFFKPNLLTAVGLIFKNPKDPKKDKAYSIIYVLGNVGTFSIPLLCAFIGKLYGFPYGVMFIIGLFILGTLLVCRTFQIQPSHIATQDAKLQRKLWATIPFFIASLYLLFRFRETFHGLMGMIAGLSLFFFAKVVYDSQGQERKNILSIAGYILLFTLFCTLFEQLGSSLLLFFDKAVNREIFGITLPASALISMNPLMLIFASPLVLLIFSLILEKKKPLDGFVKVGMGFSFVAISFGILALSTILTREGLIPILWVLAAILLQTIGELLIVPITLSKISQSSSPRFQSLMMSYWTMAIAYGHYFAGTIAQFSLKAPQHPKGLFEQYTSFFGLLGLGAFCISFTVIFYRSLKLRSMCV